MKWSALSRIGKFLFISGWLAVPVFAQQTSERSEFWPELDAFIRLNQKSRVVIQYSSTRKDNLETRVNWIAGGFVDIYFRALFDQNERRNPDSGRKRMLMFRTGYLYSPTPQGATKSSTQHIPTILADTRFSLPWTMNMAERNRFDLRFIGGQFRPLP